MIEYANPRLTPPPSSAARKLLSAFATVGQWMAGIAVPVGVSIAASIILIPSIGPLFGFGSTLLMFTAVYSLRDARRRRSMLVVSHISQIMRLNLPLAETLRLWSAGESPRVQVEMRRIAGTLDDGGGLISSLRSAARFLPERALDQIESGERNGHPSEAIEQIVAAERSRRQRDPAHWPMVKTYLLVLSLAIPFIVMLLTLFVAPKFAQILKDFHQPIPPITRIVMSPSNANASPIVTAIAAIIFFGACATAMREALSEKRWRWPLVLRQAFDFLRWYTPIIGGLDRDRGLADVCATIADGIAAARDLPTAILEADQPHLNRVLSERIHRWAHGVREGLPLAEAARLAKLPPLVVGLIGNNRSSGNVLAALRFLHRYYDGRFSRIAILIREAALPLFTLLIAAVVCAVALSIFEPLVAMAAAMEKHR